VNGGKNIVAKRHETDLHSFYKPCYSLILFKHAKELHHGLSPMGYFAGV